MIRELPVIATVPAEPAAPVPQPRLPRWLKREVPQGNANHFTANLLDELRLETVCEAAKCPNRMECWSQKTATFMVLGNVCTRPCGFCAVHRGRPNLPEADEPERLAEAALRLGLKHVVITSVTRDDLPDGGAEHFYQCVLAVRRKTAATVEVLTPDFVTCRDAVGRVCAAGKPRRSASVLENVSDPPSTIARLGSKMPVRSSSANRSRWASKPSAYV